MEFVTVFNEAFAVKAVALARSIMRTENVKVRAVALGMSIEQKKALNSEFDFIDESDLSLLAGDLGWSWHYQKDQIKTIYQAGTLAVLHVLANSKSGSWTVYCDADTYFFSPLQVSELASGGTSVCLSEHDHILRNKLRLAKFGRFNVGIVAFLADKKGRAAAMYWAERCLEWCEDRVEAGKYADQKYLEEIFKKFPPVKTFDTLRVNLGPWSKGRSQRFLRKSQKGGRTGGLQSFHFSSLRKINGQWFLPELKYFRLADGYVRSKFYLPYVLELEELEREYRLVIACETQLERMTSSNENLLRLVSLGLRQVLNVK